jgi:hypothetical protein
MPYSLLILVFLFVLLLWFSLFCKLEIGVFHRANSETDLVAVDFTHFFLCIIMISICTVLIVAALCSLCS